jgi:MFS transporter, FHS family, Na+ dependent glucose transporter 1
MTSGDRTARIPLTIGYFIGFIALGLAMAALGPTLPMLAEHTSSTIGQISVLFIAQQGGYLAGTFAGGRIYDKVPGHPVIAGVLVTMAAMLALAPLMSNLAILVVVLAVMGLAVGILDVGGNTLLIWVHGATVAPFMNGLHFCFGVGALLSPIIIDTLAVRTGDIMWPYWALALLTLPGAVWIMRLKSPAPAVESDDEAGGAGNAVLLWLIAIFFFTFVGAELGFGGWINTYAIELGQSASTGRHLTAVFWGALTAGRLLLIPVASRVSPRSILIGDLAGCLAGLGILGFWPDSPVGLWTGTFLFGFSMASMFPTAINMAERLMHIDAKTTGWFLIGGSAGSMVVPWVVGQFFESIGPGAVVVVLAVDMAVSAGIFVRLLRATNAGRATPAVAPSDA